MSRGRLTRNIIKTIMFVSRNHYTTSRSLAVELNVCIKTAERYLEALGEAGLPTIRTWESCEVGSGGQYYYRFPAEWKKKHGLL